MLKEKLIKLRVTNDYTIIYTLMLTGGMASLTLAIILNKR